MLEKLQEILERLPPNYRERLIEELNIVTDNGIENFLSYYLTVKESTDFAANNNILQGPARGSVGSSLIAYLLGLQSLDPIKYNLPLSRFISVPRLQRSVPDIDTDFPKGKRDLINKYLFDKYGDRAAFVSTYNMYKVKNGLLDAWRINILQPNEHKIKLLRKEGKKDEANSLEKWMEDETKRFNGIRKSLGDNKEAGRTDLQWLEGYTDSDENHHAGLLETNTAFIEWCAQYPKVLEDARSMLALPRSLGQHAAGVVVCDVPIHQLVPTMKTEEGYNIIVYDKKVIQKLGLIKNDNLGLVTLNFIEDTLEKLKDKGIILDPWDLPHNDEVFEEFVDGKCLALFQWDTTGGARFAKKLQPKNKEDIFSGVALNRPGSMDVIIKLPDGSEMNAAEAYIERSNGNATVEYIHPDLEPILKDTFGLFVYQEQVSKVVQDFFGYSEAEADSIRGAISDKNPKAFEEVKARLPMLLARGWTQEQADTLYGTMIAFARYSFNRSHSAGYGLISYCTAYLKHFYPLEWWSSVLTHCAIEDVMESYWVEVFHLIEQPNINISKMKFEISGGKIIPPLNLIDGVGKTAIQEITSKMPFASFEDFMERINARKVNKRVVEGLLKAGAMDCLFEPKTPFIEKIRQYAVIKSLKEKKKPDLFLSSEYSNLTPFKEYLQTKQVLPISTISLTDAILNTENINKPLILIEGVWYLRGKLPLYRGAQIAETLKHHKELDEPVSFVAYGYVIACRQFPYFSEKADMNKTGFEMVLDFDGFQIKHVAWPRKADKDPLIAKIVKEKKAYLFNIKISPDTNWTFSILGVDDITEKKEPNDKIPKS